MNKWLKVILIASLAFNIAFVVKLFEKKPRRRGTYRNEQLLDKIELSKDQRDQLDQVFKDFKINLLEFRQAILEKRVDIIEELGNPDINGETLRQQINELNEFENQTNFAFVRVLLHISNILNDTQRIDFLHQLGQRWYYFVGRPRGKQGGKRE